MEAATSRCGFSRAARRTREPPLLGASGTAPAPVSDYMTTVASSVFIIMWSQLAGLLARKDICVDGVQVAAKAATQNGESKRVGCRTCDPVTAALEAISSYPNCTASGSDGPCPGTAHREDSFGQPGSGPSSESPSATPMRLLATDDDGGLSGLSRGSDGSRFADVTRLLVSTAKLLDDEAAERKNPRRWGFADPCKEWHVEDQLLVGSLLKLPIVKLLCVFISELQTNSHPEFQRGFTRLISGTWPTVLASTVSEGQGLPQSETPSVSKDAYTTSSSGSNPLAPGANVLSVEEATICSDYGTRLVSGANISCPRPPSAMLIPTASDNDEILRAELTAPSSSHLPATSRANCPFRASDSHRHYAQQRSHSAVMRRQGGLRFAPAPGRRSLSPSSREYSTPHRREQHQRPPLTQAAMSSTTKRASETPATVDPTAMIHQIFQSSLFNLCLDQIVEARNKVRAARGSATALPVNPPAAELPFRTGSETTSKYEDPPALDLGRTCLGRRQQVISPDHRTEDTERVDTLTSSAAVEQIQERQKRRIAKLTDQNKKQEREIKEQARSRRNLKLQVSSQSQIFRALADLAAVPILHTASSAATTHCPPPPVSEACSMCEPSRMTKGEADHHDAAMSWSPNGDYSRPATTVSPPCSFSVRHCTSSRAATFAPGFQAVSAARYLYTHIEESLTDRHKENDDNDELLTSMSDRAPAARTSHHDPSATPGRGAGKDEEGIYHRRFHQTSSHVHSSSPTNSSAWAYHTPHHLNGSGSEASRREKFTATTELRAPLIPSVLAAILRGEKAYGIHVRRAVEAVVKLKVTARDLLTEVIGLEVRIRHKELRQLREWQQGHSPVMGKVSMHPTGRYLPPRFTGSPIDHQHRILPPHLGAASTPYGGDGCRLRPSYELPAALPPASVPVYSGPCSELPLMDPPYLPTDPGPSTYEPPHGRSTPTSNLMCCPVGLLPTPSQSDRHHHHSHNHHSTSPGQPYVHRLRSFERVAPITATGVTRRRTVPSAQHPSSVSADGSASAVTQSAVTHRWTLPYEVPANWPTEFKEDCLTQMNSFHQGYSTGDRETSSGSMGTGSPELQHATTTTGDRKRPVVSMYNLSDSPVGNTVYGTTGYTVAAGPTDYYSVSPSQFALSAGGVCHTITGDSDLTPIHTPTHYFVHSASGIPTGLKAAHSNVRTAGLGTTRLFSTSAANATGDSSCLGCVSPVVAGPSTGTQPAAEPRPRIPFTVRLSNSSSSTAGETDETSGSPMAADGAGKRYGAEDTAADSGGVSGGGGTATASGSKKKGVSGALHAFKKRWQTVTRTTAASNVGGSTRQNAKLRREKSFHESPNIDAEVDSEAKGSMAAESHQNHSQQPWRPQQHRLEREQQGQRKVLTAAGSWTGEKY